MAEPAEDGDSARAEVDATLPGELRVPSPNDEVPKRIKPVVRLAGLEGPRGIGCLCVILVHVSVHSAPNVLAATRIDFLGQALTFFFVLSGFLLYLPYVKRLSQRREMPSTRTYLKHRVLRVFPAYLVIFLIVNFILRIAYIENPYNLSWADSLAATGMITDPLDLLAQLTLTQSLFPSTLQTGINPAWSLTTEWGFYLILPLIGACLHAASGRIRRPFLAALWPALVLLIIGVATNVVVGILQHAYFPDDILAGYWGDNWVAVLSRSFPALADTFAFGMVAAVIYVALTDGALARWSTARLLAIASAVMMIGLFGSFALFIFNPRHLATVFAFASCALIILIVAPLARGEDSLVAKIVDWRPLKHIGTISLSTYLWHYPVLLVVERAGLKVGDDFVGISVAFAIVAIITIALGSVTYRLVELPAMRLR